MKQTPSAQVTISPTEMGKEGYPRLVRTEGIRGLELDKGPPIEVQHVTGLTSHQMTIKNGAGQQQVVKLEDINFITVTAAVAEHLKNS